APVPGAIFMIEAAPPSPPLLSSLWRVNTTPWLHPFVGDFSATTGRSVPSHRFPTMALAGLLLEPFGYHRCGRFPRSTLPPRNRVMPPSCRRPHGPKQVSSMLIPGQRRPPGFDLIWYTFRHVISGSLSFISLSPI